MKTMKIARHFLAWLLIVAFCCVLGLLAGAIVCYLFHGSHAAVSVAFFGTLLLCTLWGAFD